MPGKKALEGILRIERDEANNIQNISAAQSCKHTVSPQLPRCALVTIASVFPGYPLCYKSPFCPGRGTAEWKTEQQWQERNKNWSVIPEAGSVDWENNSLGQTAPYNVDAVGTLWPIWPIWPQDPPLSPLPELGLVAEQPARPILKWIHFL